VLLPFINQSNDEQETCYLKNEQYITHVRVYDEQGINLFED
jgi:hypothetical protein